MSTMYRLPDNDPTPEEHRKAVIVERVKFVALVENAACKVPLADLRAQPDEPDLCVAEGFVLERAIMRMLDGFLVVVGDTDKNARCPHTVTDDDGDEIARCVYGAAHEGKCSF